MRRSRCRRKFRFYLAGWCCRISPAFRRSSISPRSQRDVRMGGDPQKINPLVPCDLVIDHSVQVDAFGTPDALEQNVKMEFERNLERYQLLRWASRRSAISVWSPRQRASCTR